jgi:hypothetical protein
MFIILLNHYYFSCKNINNVDYSVAYIAEPPINGTQDTFAVDPFFTISLQINLK